MPKQELNNYSQYIWYLVHNLQRSFLSWERYAQEAKRSTCSAWFRDNIFIVLGMIMYLSLLGYHGLDMASIFFKSISYILYIRPGFQIKTSCRKTTHYTWSIRHSSWQDQFNFATLFPHPQFCWWKSHVACFEKVNHGWGLRYWLCYLICMYSRNWGYFSQVNPKEGLFSAIYPMDEVYFIGAIFL